MVQVPSMMLAPAQVPLQVYAAPQGAHYSAAQPHYGMVPMYVMQGPGQGAGYGPDPRAYYHAGHPDAGPGPARRDERRDGPRGGYDSQAVPVQALGQPPSHHAHPHHPQQQQGQGQSQGGNSQGGSGGSAGTGDRGGSGRDAAQAPTQGNGAGSSSTRKPLRFGTFN